MDIYSRIKKVCDGDAIFEEDTWPYYAYILKDGKAKVLKSIYGRQVLIGTLTKGDSFGEMDLLGKAKRTVSVVADGDVIVEMITKDTLLRLIEKLPRQVRSRLYAMAGDLTNITEIYSRLIVLLQNMCAETKAIPSETFEMETEKMPEFLRRVITTADRRHHIAVEGINNLSLQLERRQTRQLNNNVKMNEFGAD